MFPSVYIMSNVGVFSGHLWTFPAVLMATKTIYFSQEVGPSEFVNVATKTGILSQAMLFSSPPTKLFLYLDLTRA